MPIDSKELKEKLLQILSEAVSKDNDLRQSLQIGDKFKFIRDRLQVLKADTETVVESIKLVDDVVKKTIGEDEQLVYVYIFNAHGIEVQSWIKLLHPSVYYEYSVNRPIYFEKEHIEAVIRGKQKRVQHGYMTVAVKKDLILSTPATSQVDQSGNPLAKIKEGSLKPERLISFTHNDVDYYLSESGRLEKVII
jgi:Dot/Icm secretion system protein (dot_icm_IcmQ)